MLLRILFFVQIHCQFPHLHECEIPQCTSITLHFMMLWFHLCTLKKPFVWFNATQINDLIHLIENGEFIRRLAILFFCPSVGNWADSQRRDFDFSWSRGWHSEETSSNYSKSWPVYSSTDYMIVKITYSYTYTLIASKCCFSKECRNL